VVAVVAAVGYLRGRMRGRSLALLALLAALALSLAGCGGGENDDAGPVGAGPANEFHPAAGKFEPDDTELADCKGESRCVEQAFGNLAYEDGPKPTLKLFGEKMQTDKGVESNCHRIVHNIGSASLARYEGNVARAFSEGDAICWSGYYHGILERSFANATTQAEMGTIARTVCEDDGVRADTFIAYQCVHGLGHGLMIQSGYNLPAALEICDALATDWDQTSCTGGVFMENISSSYGVKSKWLKDDNLVYPCDKVAKRHKTYCYLMVTSRILEATDYDFKGAAKTCSTVEAYGKPLCFQSLGRDASGFTRQNPVRIRSICGLAGAGRQECIYGAARDIVSNDAGTPRAVRLCDSVGVVDQPRCFQGVGTIVGTLEGTTDGRRRACLSATRKYLAQCLRGAGVPTAA
jgi:hypothetical protein